jgi:Ca2+-binding RTX toxin-like protein
MEGSVCPPALAAFKLPANALALFALMIAATLLAPAAKLASASGGHACLGRKATMVSSAKRIVGTKAPDVIVATGAGRHTIEGLGGNDRICGGPGEDEIDGGKGIDRLSGGGGNDTVLGFKGPDRLAGGAGNDLVNGQQGSDRIDGGPGDDKLLGEKGNEDVRGGPGDDEVDGGPGDDDLVDGGPGADSVIGGVGTDNVTGGSGDGDVVRGDSGEDRLSGGPGAEDVVSYASATRRGVIVDLRSNLAKGDGHDSLSGFENAVGSPQNDTLMGDSGPNDLDGGVGDDILVGAGGGGTGFGGPGSDTCSGFAAEFSCGPEATPPAGVAYVVVSLGLDGASLVVRGSSGPDQLRISFAPDGWHVTNVGRLAAGDGCVQASAGAVSCPAPPLNLLVATGEGGDDSVVVDPSVPATVAVRINGNAGSDTLVGGVGSDTLEAGENYKNPDSGNDTLEGNGGTDVLFADPGADVLRGGPGNDLLASSVPTCQGHTYEGGPGIDTVSYARATVGVTVTVEGSGGPSGCATPDRLLDDESLEGSDLPDTLVGDNGRNSLLGHLGADTFIGKGGDDFVDAADGRRDKRVDCGGGNDEALLDGSDPSVNC